MTVKDPESTAGLKADNYQFGGVHYAGEYQHWNFVIATGIGYLEGNATKYLSRWRKTTKGEMDLRKASHYVNKLIEAAGRAYPTQRKPQRWLRHEVIQFCRANQISGVEVEAIVALTTWEVVSDLRVAAEAIDILLGRLTAAVEAIDRLAAAVPLEDSNKHAERSVPRFPLEEEIEYDEGP